MNKSYEETLIIQLELEIEQLSQQYSTLSTALSQHLLIRQPKLTANLPSEYNNILKWFKQIKETTTKKNWEQLIALNNPDVLLEKVILLQNTLKKNLQEVNQIAKETQAKEEEAVELADKLLTNYTEVKPLLSAKGISLILLSKIRSKKFNSIIKADTSPPYLLEEILEPLFEFKKTLMEQHKELL